MTKTSDVQPAVECKQYWLDSSGEMVEVWPQPVTTWELWRGDRLIAKGSSGGESQP